MTRGSTIIWGKDELTRAPAPDAKHIRRDFNSASKREGFHTSTHLFASVSAMVTRRRKTSQHFGVDDASLSASSASFKRSNVIQSLIDVGALLFGLFYVLLWIMVILGLFPFTLFCLLFVSFH